MNCRIRTRKSANWSLMSKPTYTFGMSPSSLNSAGFSRLETRRVEEALDCLEKAETLAPKKEYICHKIAQAHLGKGNPDQALKAYERIPPHRRAAYIFHGIAQCYMARGEMMDAARKLYQAIQRESRKFYHHWDFALALIALGAKDQAMEAGERISFEESSSHVAAISVGVVRKYDANRGFGFVKDRADGADVFFHITRVKGQVVPRIGTRTRYLRERGEKGFQAAKVWFLDR